MSPDTSLSGVGVHVTATHLATADSMGGGVASLPLGGGGSPDCPRGQL